MRNTADVIWDLVRQYSMDHNMKPTHVIIPVAEYQKFAKWIFTETGSQQSLPLQWYGMRILSSYELDEIKVGTLI